MGRKWVVRIAFGFGFVFGGFFVNEALGSTGLEDHYLKTLRAISDGIEGLKKEFPQLKDFSTARNLVVVGSPAFITYDYHTHREKHRVGWVGGVPNPNKDGIWFHIDFHDKNDPSQLYTQPMTPYSLCIGDKAVCFLILEGSNTRDVSGRIWDILQKNGVKDCQTKK